jgi:cell division septal protein FtsQ
VRWIGARILWLAAVLTIGSGGVLAAAWALRSPMFAVATVEVIGHNQMTRQEIKGAADIGPGVNLFRLDTAEVVARLEALPLVRRAEVIRSLPNRVTLVVAERRPFTLVHAGTLRWIDEQGVDLGRESRAVAPGTPVLTGLDAGDLGSGQRSPSERAAAGIALVRLLVRSQSHLLARISEIDLSRAEGPVLYTLEGVEVRLGANDWEARLGRLQGVLAQLAASGEAVASIDLRFRDQVVFKTAAK